MIPIPVSFDKKVIKKLDRLAKLESKRTGVKISRNHLIRKAVDNFLGKEVKK